MKHDDRLCDGAAQRLAAFAGVVVFEVTDAFLGGLPAILSLTENS
jgi:hypothetical protein